eukprot:Partr_v1_DN27270_c0_g1_i1_m39054 putative (ABC) transporter
MNSSATDSKDAAPKPMERNPTFIKQLGVMCVKSFLLQMRYLKMTLVQVIMAPFLCLLLLFIIKSSLSSLITEDSLDPPEFTLAGVPACTPAYRSPLPCISLMYSPNTDTRVNDIMDIFADMNRKRQGSSAGWNIDSASWTPSLDSLPSRSLGVVGAPDDTFIYDYADKHPNVTFFGASFNIVPLVEDPAKTNVQYQLWYNSTETTRNYRPAGAPAFVVEAVEPFNDHVVSMMRGLDEAIMIYYSTGREREEKLQLALKDFPDVSASALIECPFNPDDVFNALGPVLLYIPMSVIFFSAINGIVNEKETKLKDAMEMIGLYPSVYWLAHFFSYSLVVLLNSFSISIFGVIFGFSFFRNTNFLLIILIFFTFGMALVALATFLGGIFAKVRTAVVAGFMLEIIAIIYIIIGGQITYLWYTPDTSSTNLNPVWQVLMFLPFFNYNKLMRDIFAYTSSSIKTNQTLCALEKGTRFGFAELEDHTKAWESNNLIPDPSQSFGLLFMNIVLFLLLAMYLDQILPNEHGYSKHPLYFLFPSHWGFKDPAWMAPPGNAADDVPDSSKPPADEDVDVVAERKTALAASQSDEKYGLLIQSLHKRYDSGLRLFLSWICTQFRVGTNWVVGAIPVALGTSKVAIHELSLSVDRGEMLALLGSNGAGKTSTMKIMYGQSPATAGNAFIFGHNLRNDMNVIRSNLGVCPQFDVLFPDLSAKEHIELFCGIKGLGVQEISGVIEDRLKQMKLWDVRDQRSSQFSGGMKRRLSVILSTLGDPQCVFLDEPTTGMDPVNKRHVWKFLETFKRGRVIVLTTHSMEEADILADKIAIMTRGRLKAVGKSLHLKNKFGKGYRVTLTIPNADNVTKVKDLIKEACPPAVLVEEEQLGGNDSAIARIARLVYELQEMKDVKTMIQFLEKSTKRKARSQENIAPNAAEEKGDASTLIGTFGLSQTTLEDVFLAMVKEE